MIIKNPGLANMIVEDVFAKLAEIEAEQDGGFRHKDCRKEAAKAIINLAFDAIKQAADEDNTVIISNFGKFQKRHRASRKSRNPLTGEAIQTEEKDIIAFTPNFKF